MTNHEYVVFCYHNILNRGPSEEEVRHYTDLLSSNEVTRDFVLRTFFSSNEYRALRENIEFVPSGHFYSAIPSNEDREKYLNSPDIFVPEPNISDVNLNVDYQVRFIEEMYERYDDFCNILDNQNGRYIKNNGSFEYMDAFVLFSMLRLLGPEKIIEIGSGYSSALMMDVNELFLDNRTDMTFIEPFPDVLYDRMRSFDRKKYKVFPQKIQDVESSIVSSLKENDVLFIDSTHVSKLCSDVNKIYFEILPLVPQGVYIHIHDIFWPFDYPKEWIQEKRAWNEIYVLHALLMNNSSYEVVMFNDLIQMLHREWLKDKMPLLTMTRGGSFWLKKIN